LQAIASLDREQTEDQQMHAVYGPRWDRTSSSILTRHLREKGNEFREKLNVAQASNNSVQKKIDKSLFLIEHLSMNRSELEASIPSSTASTTLALKDPNLKKLKILLEELNNNIKQRGPLIDRLKKLSETDDIGNL
jgi:programmed cell death 6-interacting protein